MRVSDAAAAAVAASEREDAAAVEALADAVLAAFAPQPA